MMGPNGEVLKITQSDIDHIVDLSGDCEQLFRFTCAWCRSTIDIAVEIDPDSDETTAAVELFEQHKWVMAEDDDQTGICCRPCRSTANVPDEKS
jgi:hypothetical protein